MQVIEKKTLVFSYRAFTFCIFYITLFTHPVSKIKPLCFMKFKRCGEYVHRLPQQYGACAQRNFTRPPQNVSTNITDDSADFTLHTCDTLGAVSLGTIIKETPPKIITRNTVR